MRTLTEESFYRRLPTYRLLAAASVAITVVICCAQQIRRRDGDPELFVNAARLLLSGQDIYMIPSPHGNYYYYPPFFAFLNAVLIPLPAPFVTVLWTLATVALLGWSVAAFYGDMNGRPFFSLPVKARWVVCFFSTLLAARFIILHLRFGQTNVLVLALAVLGLRWVTTGRPVRAGLAIAFSIVVKLTTLPFGFWFLARRGWKVLLGMILGGLIGVALPALAVGVARDAAYHREWVESVVLSNAAGSGKWSNTGNVSLRAQADRFFLKADAFVYKDAIYHVTVVELPPSAVRLIGYLIMFCVALAIVIYAVRFRRASRLVGVWGGYAFVFSLIPSFSTVTEIPHLVLLLPAYIYLVHVWYVLRLKDRLFRSLFALSFILTTLTTGTFLGQFLGRFLAAIGFISLGILLLPAAIYRAGVCLESEDKLNDSLEETDAPVEAGGGA
ncbi:MAG TPA: glycosyltransferase family 87 protein [Pyrinomonadaceae bacterium]|nr:glycosyltransferase family 87 protein [Pyrinomonadaceae bacterium]